MQISSIAKYIDQPYVILNLQKKMPAFLVSSAIAYGTYDTFKQPRGAKTKQAIKNTAIFTSIIASLLYGGRKLKIGGKSIIETPKAIETVLKQNRAVIGYLKNNTGIDATSKTILKKLKSSAISPKEIEHLQKNLPKGETRERLFKTIFSESNPLTSKEIFAEIGRLSALGFLPVAAGITGGIAADKITKTSSKNGTANKIKEGAYQFLANIFLCNIGAGAALFGIEALNRNGVIKNLTPAKKLIAILSGITATGIVGGSFIANYLCQKFINPIFDKHNPRVKKLYSERKPETLDIAMHSDDIATAGVLSGFKWIEPALPLMYMMSGYRAGIGYRNNIKEASKKNITLKEVRDSLSSQKTC